MITTKWRDIFNVHAAPRHPLDPLVGTKVSGIPVAMTKVSDSSCEVSFTVECLVGEDSDPSKYFCTPDGAAGYTISNFNISKDVVRAAAAAMGGGTSSVKPPPSWGDTLAKVLKKLPVSRNLAEDSVDVG
jgi:hypothetical protein